MKSEYTVGEVLTCSTDARPEPDDYVWFVPEYAPQGGGPKLLQNGADAAVLTLPGWLVPGELTIRCLVFNSLDDDQVDLTMSKCVT